MNDTDRLSYMKWNCKYHYKKIYVNTIEMNKKTTDEYISNLFIGRNEFERRMMPEEKTRLRVAGKLPFTRGSYIYAFWALLVE